MKNESRIQSRARLAIASRTTLSLCELMILTNASNDPEIPTVRGWIMDELEHRDPEAFSLWLDGTAEDSDLFVYYCVRQ